MTTLRRIRRTGRGGVVVIAGDPGIGKTAVLTRLLREASASGFRVGSARATVADQLSPGLTFLLALRAGDDPVLTAEQVEALTSSATQPAVFVDRATAFIAESVRRAPTAVALDDLQWADPLSRTAARVVPQRLGDRPMAWLYTSRKALSDPSVHTLTLAPLPSGELLALGADLLGGELDPATASLLGRVGGNPFLAVQIIEDVLRARATGGAVAQIPAGLAAGLRRRLAALPDSAAHLIQDLAVFGRPATFAECCGLRPEDDRATVSAAADALTTAGLLINEGNALTFRHDLIREAVYEGLSPGARRRLHRRCAGLLLADGSELLAVAGHVRAAAMPGDESAAAVLLDAAREAPPADAAALAVDAFRLVRPRQASWHETGIRAIRALVAAQRSTAAVELADTMIAASTSPDRMAQIEVAAAQALMMTGRVGDLVTRSAARLADGGLSDLSRARLTANIALASIGGQPAERIRALTDESSAFAEQSDDPASLTTVAYTLAMLAMNQGRHSETLHRLRELRAAAGDAYLMHELNALHLLDRFDDAAAMIAAAGTAPWVPYARMWQHLHLGRIRDGEAQAHQMLADADEFGNRSLAQDARRTLVHVALVRGEPDLARDQLDDCVRAVPPDDEIQVDSNDLMRAWLLLTENRTREAAALIAGKLQAAREDQSYWPWWPGWMPVFVRAGLAVDDEQIQQDAIWLAEQAEKRNPGIAVYAGLSRQVRGLVHADLTLLRDAEQILADSPRPILRAAIADDLGRALLDAGMRAEAVTRLDRAWDLYHGAEHYAAADRVRSLLVGLGLRRAQWPPTPDRAVTGWESLTRSEHTVAQLIASGLTNRAAAAQLALSPNTIGTHVRAVYAKLGIRSRVQLTNLLRDQGHLPGVINTTIKDVPGGGNAPTLGA
jgi:DNA-binding CsgD family transcriptional regulator/nucleoside-triphosphatase THEP1